MFIISLNYKASLEEIDKYLEPHIAYLKNEYANGSFIASGRKNPRTGGVILSKIQSKNELEMILAKDPFYIADVAEYEIIEFTPTMTANSFENLKES